MYSGTSKKIKITNIFIKGNGLAKRLFLLFDERVDIM